MKVRTVFGLMLSVVLLLVAPGSSLAREPQPTGPSEAVGVNADPAANAPWFNITVDAYDVGQYTSVAIDPVNDFIYVSYYDATNQALRLAMYRGFGSGGNCGPNNSWLCQTVDSGADFGKYSSIAIKPASGGGIYYPEIGIAYYDATNGKLKYAYGKICPTCVWYKYTIDEALGQNARTGQYTSLQYHSNGTPYIAYYFENDGNVDALMLAYYKGSGGNCANGSIVDWQCDTIQTGEGVGQYASLALDGSNRPSIAYYDGGNNALMYAYQNGGSWTIRGILPTNSGQYASLYVDNGDIPHIAHYDSSNGELGYAVYVGLGGNANCGVFDTKFWWRCDEIASMGTSTHPKGVSMAEDAAGYPIIAYQSENGSLNVARPAAALGLAGGGGTCGFALFPSFQWYCETIDPGYSLGPVINGDFVSIDLNSSGLATIAYYNHVGVSNIGKLKVAYQQFQVLLPLVMKNQ